MKEEIVGYYALPGIRPGSMYAGHWTYP